jgi:G3E family GTPase
MSRDDLPPKPPSVTLIGGFLGAGKTTLLARLLRQAGGLRIGVLVNDFGEVNIDAELIAEVEGGVMRLQNGCICCTIKNDVTRALFQLLERERLDHVVIEASGISDLSALAEAFLELHRRAVLRLDGLIAVVDAGSYRTAERDHRELLEAQVRAADVVVLNKVDLATEPELVSLEAELRRLSPRARMIRAAQGEVPLALLFGVETDPGRFDQIPVHDHAEHDGAHGFEAITFREERPLSWAALAPILVQLPAAVFRVKGLLQLQERPGDRILLQIVAGRVYLRTLGTWGDAARSELVLIGAPGALEADAIRERLRACAA